MSKIAIKGHASRGKEVIEILEILGGKNIYNLPGDTSNIYYVIESGKIVRGTRIHGYEPCTFFTLEEFLEKYPYKVGDKVICDEEDIGKIVGMSWDYDVDEIYYSITSHDEIFKYPVDLLQPYEKPKELLIGFTKDTDGNWVLNTHKDYEIKEVNGKFKLILKKPQYPKTYNECCDVLKIPNDERYIDIDVPYVSNYNKLLSAFAQLLICRDAYWRIAGEQMGLDKSWEPDWSTEYEIKYVIEVYRNNVIKNTQCYSNTILAFPTEEMRDIFYENFKELIETCKELL